MSSPPPHHKSAILPLYEQTLPLWANKTWIQRKNLVARMDNFVAEQDRNPSFRALSLPIKACAFVANIPNITYGTRVNYVSNIKSILDLSGIDTSDMVLYRKALNVSKASEPIRQATPIPRVHLLNVFHRLMVAKPFEALALWLAWKTASRWSDICNLTFKNFLLVTPVAIVIHFANLTKTTKNKPFDQRTLVVIHDRSSMIWQVNTIIALRRHPKQPISKWTTEQVSDALSANSTTRYTAHSIKRGALTHLIPHLTASTLHILPILAKHSSTELLPESTIRYLSADLQRLAILLGTQKLTKLL